MAQHLTVSSEHHGQRLDRFIVSQLPELSRSFVQHLIEDGQIRVDECTLKANHRLKSGEIITITIPPPDAARTRAEAIPLDIVYEDDSLIVINKPAGMVVHPATGHEHGTLVNAVLSHAPEMVVGNEERPGVVHRLDRDTSGLIVIAKTDPALHALQHQFAGRTVHKTYLALVHGKVNVAQGKIDAPIGRDPRDRKKMAVVSGAHGRAGVTIFRTLDTNDLYSLLQVEPQTGRTHQIRVHLAFIKHPVVGDEIYGRKKDTLGLTRQFLHAWRLEFTHPVTQGSLAFIAPLPSELQEALNQARLELSRSDQ